MTDDAANRTPDDKLERYLDGQLSPEENAEIEAHLRSNPIAARQVKMQHQVDERLRANFVAPAMTAQRIEKLLCDETMVAARDSSQQRSKTERNRRLVIVASVIAASIAIAYFSRFGIHPEVKPYFEPRSLVAIYNETVDQGFRPYYFCEDADRFAMTFAKRQQTPLVLEELPADRHMVGLSYPGGLSRDTTAILCYADQKPVVVFVDRGEYDNESVVAFQENQGLYVHKRLLSDLVIYEVSPFPESKFTDALRLTKPGE